MTQSAKKAALLLLVPLALATCATLVNLNQITASPTAAGSVVVVQPGGGLGTATLSGLTLTGGVLSAPAPAAPALPSVDLTQVTANTPNAYALPPGRTECIVTRNGVTQAGAGIDYSVTSGNIVFVTVPNVGDIVQRICF